jgi:hypothetical protein
MKSAPRVRRPHTSLDGFEPTEPNRNEFPSLELPCRILVDDSQQLRVFRSPGQNQASPRLELFKQSRGRPVGRDCDKNLVEWGVLGPAARSISDANDDVGGAETLQQSLGMACEFLDDFDAPNLPGMFGEDRGLIAKTGADLEHRLVRLGSKEIGHESDDEGLRDGFIEANRQRHVLVSIRVQPRLARSDAAAPAAAMPSRSSSAALPSSWLERRCLHSRNGMRHCLICREQKPARAANRGELSIGRGAGRRGRHPHWRTAITEPEYPEL